MPTLFRPLHVVFQLMDVVQAVIRLFISAEPLVRSPESSCNVCGDEISLERVLLVEMCHRPAEVCDGPG